jgi:glycosyltransferase involved in cell wall biosynthesis
VTVDSRAALVSVIVPAYNAAAFIAETLGSALAQTYRDIEVIVVDDGSTDNTAEIVKSIRSQDQRVRLLTQQNSGAAAARNYGIDQSRGALIAPLDADDLWRPDKLAKQVAVMRSSGPEVGMVYAWSASIDESGRVLPRIGNFARHEGDIFPFLVFHNFIGNGSAPLIRRDCVLDAGGYDTTLSARGGECEDLMLYLRIAERYKVILVPAILVGYRVRQHSLSSNAWRMRRGHELVLEAVRARHPDIPARLCRWSRSFNCMNLGRRCLRRGKTRAAAWLLACALAYDPVTLVEPSVRRTFGRLIVEFIRNTESIKNERSEACNRFLDPWMEFSVPPARATEVLSRRRYAFLRSLVGHTNHRTLESKNVDLGLGQERAGANLVQSEPNVGG